jgi:hypothetical protein
MCRRLEEASTCVPEKESLAPEHGCELLADALEHLLDGGGVAHKGGGHLEALGRDITDGRLDVVGDPLHEVGGVLVLDVEHLLIDLQHTNEFVMTCLESVISCYL